MSHIYCNKLYDLNGRFVRELVNQEKEAGYYNIAWDGTDNTNEIISSGIYLGKIVAGKYKKTIKLIVSK